MSLYKPSELFAFLNQMQCYPKKRLSQSFLIDGNVIQKILRTAACSSKDLIVEIGPGPGALTQALLKTGATVLAIEKDHSFASALQRLDPSKARLQVYCEDFLSFPLEELLKDKPFAKVVSNIPYHLTSPILGKLMPMHSRIHSLTLMMQKEVGQRCIALPNDKNYSALTLFLSCYATVSYAFTVQPSSFYPQPKVHSSVLHFLLKPPPPIELPTFFTIVKTAFQHRRKMLRSSLKDLYLPHQIESHLSHIGFSPLSRPENLSFEAFLQLTAALSSQNPT